MIRGYPCAFDIGEEGLTLFALTLVTELGITLVTLVSIA